MLFFLGLCLIDLTQFCERVLLLVSLLEKGNVFFLFFLGWSFLIVLDFYETQLCSGGSIDFQRRPSVVTLSQWWRKEQQRWSLLQVTAGEGELSAEHSVVLLTSVCIISFLHF